MTVTQFIIECDIHSHRINDDEELSLLRCWVNADNAAIAAAENNILVHEGEAQIRENHRKKYREAPPSWVTAAKKRAKKDFMSKLREKAAWDVLVERGFSPMCGAKSLPEVIGKSSG